jgi:hypothetical protein
MNGYYQTMRKTNFESPSKITILNKTDHSGPLRLQMNYTIEQLNELYRRHQEVKGKVV